MIYLIGGAPRAGKSVLCQQVSAKLKAGWISTDLIAELLRMKNEAGVKMGWDATLEAIRQEAQQCSYPYVNMVGDFTQCLNEAESVLTTHS
jgi:predicted kinase